MAIDKTTVLGLKEAQNVFRQLEPIARQAFNEAVEKTAEQIVATARTRVRVRTGRLRESLGATMNRRSGSAKVGIRTGFELAMPGRTGRIHRPTAIGHLVEFGHGGPRPARAHPFLVPAAESMKSFFLAQARAAGSTLERGMGNVGSRNL